MPEVKLIDIQQRNKPIEPPKAPEKVPFFIPTVPGLEPRFAMAEQAESTEKSKKKKSKKLKAGESQVESMFKAKLKSEDSEGNCQFHINSLSPLV